MKEVKMPKYILEEVRKTMLYEIKKREAITKVYNYLEDQGIDTYDDKFADSIGVRLANAEFQGLEEFQRDINKFANGEEVGYG